MSALIKKVVDFRSDEELKGIAGLSFKTEGQVIHNEDRPFIEDLDSLPWVSKVYKKHLDIRNGGHLKPFTGPNPP